MNAQRPPISILDEKIMACSFWTHLVCFMFMSIWFSTKCFTAFSVASFMSMWFSTQCLKSLSAHKCFNMCSKSHLPTHAVFFWLALPSCQPKCAPKLCHAGQPWHVHCILGYIYAMHFVWQGPPPGDEAWSTQPNDCQLLCFNCSFRFHLTLQHQLDQQRLAHQDQVAWNLVSKHQ